MAGSAVPVPSDQPTLEQKIDAAAMQAAQIAALFSAPAAKVIEMGVAVEPVVAGLIKLFAGLFSHHAKQAVSSAGK